MESKPVVLRQGTYFLGDQYDYSKNLKGVPFDKKHLIQRVELISFIENEEISPDIIVPFGGSINLEYRDNNMVTWWWESTLYNQRCKFGIFIGNAKRLAEKVGASYFSLENVQAELVPFDKKLFKQHVGNSSTKITGIFQRYVLRK